MNSLSLQQWVIAFRWNHDGNPINKQISRQEATRDNLNGAIIRIGREKSLCNLHLEDSSVSPQHAEIYFNEQQQRFFIQSLQSNNTIKVDGQDLVYGEELPLKRNSTIALGMQQIEVTNIQVFEIEPTNYSGVVRPVSNPLQQWVIAFRWNHDGNPINKQISKQEATRDNLNGAIIRIGREKPSCNLHLEDSSVSRQHAEIYFNEQQQKFFIKSLQPNNTTKVDGQDLVYGGELPLRRSSIIFLGMKQIEVTNIQIFEIESTNYSGMVNSPSNPIPVNSPSNPIPVNSPSNPIPVNSPPNPIPVNSPPNSNKSKHLWQEPTVQVAIIGAIVTLVGGLLTWNANNMTQETTKKIKEMEVQAERQKQQNQFQIDKEKLYLEKLDKHREDVRQQIAEMKQKKEPYNQLTLVNNSCPSPVMVVLSFTALDDKLETRGWFSLERGILPVPISAVTLYDGVFLYAKTKINDKDVIWKPINKGSIIRTIFFNDFIYIQEPYLDPKKDQKDQKEDVTFYNVKFDKGKEITNKAFKCSDQGISLENADEK